MDKDHQKELQLLPPPPPTFPPHDPPSTTSRAAVTWLHRHRHRLLDERSLDLKLSISLEPVDETACVESIKWQTAEQIRLAAIEKAYAERVRELTRREIELAQSEFSLARAIWAKARDEIARAERLRDSNTACMGREITCHSCRQRFRP